jgi:hypothetical protein
MIPFPDLELTVEQQFELKKLEEAIDDASRENLEHSVWELSRQIYILRNTIKNLIKHWPNAFNQT